MERVKERTAPAINEGINCGIVILKSVLAALAPKSVEASSIDGSIKPILANTTATTNAVQKTVWEMITVVRLNDIEIVEKVVSNPIAKTRSGIIAGAVENVLKNPPAFILLSPIEIEVPIINEKTVVNTATKIVL
jgi:hypothetical protein